MGTSVDICYMISCMILYNDTLVSHRHCYALMICCSIQLVHRDVYLFTSWHVSSTLIVYMCDIMCYVLWLLYISSFVTCCDVCCTCCCICTQLLFNITYICWYVFILFCFIIHMLMCIIYFHVKHVYCYICVIIYIIYICWYIYLCCFILCSTHMLL